MEGWVTRGLIQLSLGTHKAWSSPTFFPLPSTGQTGSHRKMLPPNPSPGLRHFSGLLWRCSIPRPSLWRHNTSQHTPSPGDHQHSLGRETATGRGPAGTGQGEHDVAAGTGEAQQAVSMTPEASGGAPCPLADLSH